MKKMIVTGGAGFLGSAAANYFRERGFQIYGVGHGYVENSHFTSWISSDVTIESLKATGIIPDVIIHCASGGSVHHSTINPHEDFLKCVLSTANVLEFSRQTCPGVRVIVPSSAAVYGNVSKTPIFVTDPLKPVSPYGTHKKLVEELCTMYQKEYGIDVALIRFFSIYGEGLQKQLLWEACRKLSITSGPVEFWGTGNEVRDWLHVSDALRLIDRVLDMEKNNIPLVINGGSGIGVTINDVVSMLRSELNSSAEIIFNNQVREGDPKFYIADMSQVVDYNAKIQLSDGLKKYVAWFRRSERYD